MTMTIIKRRSDYRASRAVAATVLGGVLLTGCAALTPERSPVPLQRHGDAAIAGPTPIRYWGDEAPPHAREIVTRVRAALTAAHVAAGAPEEGLTTPILALSGGAWDGAYGAGLFAGWTVCGTRPEFALVTGVSTGALLAPFVFLGPAYDEEMERAFTNLDDDALPSPSLLRAAFGALGLADMAPLARYIAGFATQDMLDAIGREYAKGRNMLIGTTNLDAERPVTWNIGALATSGRPDRLELFRKVLLASSAVPGAFAPVFIDVEVGDERFSEMHVDGGVTNSVFLLPFEFDISNILDIGFKNSIDIYVVQNNKIEPQAENVQMSITSIIQRSIGALIRSQNRGDIARIYLSSRKKGLNFFLGSVPDTFDPGEGVEVGFNRDYMRAAFDIGYGQGAAGYPWRRSPPGFDAASDDVDRSLCRSAPPAAAARRRRPSAAPHDCNLKGIVTRSRFLMRTIFDETHSLPRRRRARARPRRAGGGAWPWRGVRDAGPVHLAAE